MMTNDEQERIWVQPDVKGYCITGVWPCKPSEPRNVQEYIHADHAQAEIQAAVAVAYEDAAILCSVLQQFPQLRAIGSTIHEDLANDIRARVDTDPLAARDARVRAEALRDAAKECEPFDYDGVGDRMCKIQCQRRILALIPADQEGDE